MKAKISVGTSAFIMGAYESSPIPFPKVVQRLGQLGYDGLELAANPTYGSLGDWPDKASRKELVQMLGDAGLEISSYGADLQPSPFYSNNPCVREDYRDLFKACIEFCVDCNIPVMRLDTLAGPPCPEGVTYDDAWNRAVEAFRWGSEIADDAGVVIAWEFEPGFMFNRPSEIVKLIAEVEHPNFQTMFDFCHAYMVTVVGSRQIPPTETLDGGLVELAGQLKDRIGFVHLIDSDGTLHDEMTSTHAPFGTGFVDMKAAMQAMLDAGYRGPWWTIDLCFWPQAWEELKPSLNFTRQLLQDFGLL